MLTRGQVSGQQWNGLAVGDENVGTVALCLQLHCGLYLKALPPSQPKMCDALSFGVRGGVFSDQCVGEYFHHTLEF